MAAVTSSSFSMEAPVASSSQFNNQLLFSFLAFLISACLLYLGLRASKSKIANLPPGPPGWPIVGNLFQFLSSGKQFFDFADEMRKRYGPICTLQMGSRTLIIVSDAKLCHEALIVGGALFASRPPETPTRTIFSSNKFTVNAALYGPAWRTLRRNMVQNGLSSSRVKEFQKLRVSAMDKFIDRIQSEAQSNGGQVWVLKAARYATFCILLEMCFGIELDEDTIEKMDEVMKAVLITVIPRIDDYLPILQPFFWHERKNALQVRKNQEDFVAPLIERRRKAILNPGSDKHATAFSYLDTLYDLKIEGRESGPSNEELVSLCSEFLNGGTDTTATAIEWGIAQLILNPDVQSRMYNEIKSTVGDRKVDEKDIDKMPYLQAVVKELLRKHPPTYFSLTHSPTETTTLGGYQIPAGVNLEFFLPGIAEDPKLWTEPERFDPDRFYKGLEEADITGVKGVKMIPFGMGRRICPGMGMATLHVSLMLARMVQEFEWSAYPPGSKLDLTGRLEFTVVMKDPLRAMVKPRA